MKCCSFVCWLSLCCFFPLAGQEVPLPPTSGSAPKSQGSAPIPPIFEAQKHAGLEDKGEPMNNERLGELIESIADEFDGRPGYWRFSVLNVEMACVTDEKAGRMRIISPIKSASELTDKEFKICMSANFNKALDARYCVNKGVLWSAFIHPLGDLTPELLYSAILQVAGANLNFGTSYSSAGFKFGGDDDIQGQKEAEEKKQSKPPSVLL